jgi:hypothetical protein
MTPDDPKPSISTEIPRSITPFCMTKNQPRMSRDGGTVYMNTSFWRQRIITTLVQKLIEDRDTFGYPAIHPCTDSEIEDANYQFTSEMGHGFPDGYIQLLRLTNGIYQNGLTIWPIKENIVLRESILEANRQLQDTLSDSYIYFAQLDEELYVFDRESKTWCGIEYVGLPVWIEFQSAEKMYEFILDRAI